MIKYAILPAFLAASLSACGGSGTDDAGTQHTNNPSNSSGGTTTNTGGGTTNTGASVTKVSDISAIDLGKIALGQTLEIQSSDPTLASLAGTTLTKVATAGEFESVFLVDVVDDGQPYGTMLFSSTDFVTYNEKSEKAYENLPKDFGTFLSAVPIGTKGYVVQGGYFDYGDYYETIVDVTKTVGEEQSTNLEIAKGTVYGNTEVDGVGFYKSANSFTAPLGSSVGYSGIAIVSQGENGNRNSIRGDATLIANFNTLSGTVKAPKLQQYGHSAALDISFDIGKDSGIFTGSGTATFDSITANPDMIGTFNSNADTAAGYLSDSSKNLTGSFFVSQ